MEEQQRNIDEFFRQSLGDYREEPPAAAWEAVRERLNADGGRRRRFFAWWVWVSVLLLLVTGAWLVAEQLDGGPQRKTDMVAQRGTSQEPAGLSKGGDQSATKPSSPVLDSSENADDRRGVAVRARNAAVDSTQHPGHNPTATSTKTHSPNSARRGARQISSAGRRTRPALIAGSSRSPNNSASKRHTVGQGSRAQLSRARRGGGIDTAIETARDMDPRMRTKNATSSVRPRRKADTSGTGGIGLSARSMKSNERASTVSDSSVAKRRPIEQRERGQGNQLLPATVPSTPPRTAANGTATPAVRAGTSAVVPKLDSSRSSKGPPEKTGNAEPPVSLTAKSPAAPPAEKPKGAIETIAAAGIDAIANPKPPSNPAKAFDNRGAEGIPVLPNFSASEFDSSSSRNPSLTGGATDVDDEEEESDTLAKPTRKRPTRFSLTPLVGFELNTQGAVPNRFAGSMRLQWHFSRSWSVGVEPSYRSSNVKNVTLQGQQTFQRSSAVTVDSFFTPVFGTTLRNYYYYISQDFDSIVVPGKTAGGKLWELELPLTFRYVVPRTGLFLYGGPTMVFGGKLASSRSGTLQTYSSQRRDSIILLNRLPPYQRPSGDTFVNYFGTPSLPPISSYDSSAVVDLVHPSATRFGYAAGLGYEWRRAVLDVSIHKQLTGYSAVNAQLRGVYASPYVRLCLGYRIGGGKGENSSRRSKARDREEKVFLQRF